MNCNDFAAVVSLTLSTSAASRSVEEETFFHSVAAGLERMLLHSTAGSRHVLRNMPLDMFSSDTRTIMKHLRFLCAEHIRQWTWEELLDYFISATF